MVLCSPAYAGGKLEESGVDGMFRYEDDYFNKKWFLAERMKLVPTWARPDYYVYVGEEDRSSGSIMLSFSDRIARLDSQATGMMFFMVVLELDRLCETWKGQGYEGSIRQKASWDENPTKFDADCTLSN